MKSYLKLLMAIILILSCIAVFASCGEDEEGGNNNNTDTSNRPDIDIVIPPDTGLEETYRVQFVYRYYLTYINDYDRMESKPFTERKVTLDIPLDNNGFSDEQLKQILGCADDCTDAHEDREGKHYTAITHNGYGFMDWYLGWDEDNYTVTGEAFDFATDNAKITSDMTFYAYRGNLAGEDATWAITTEGEGKNQETILTLSGTGALFDYEAVTNIDIPWYSERSKITKVVIGEGITHIGANTLNGLYACDDVTFPESLESIGTAAFRGMTKLTALETPKNLKSIGVSAFAETSLKSVILNEGLVEISDQAFNESNKIVSIIVPSSLKLIKSGAFHPGSVDGKVNSSALKYVYYLGTEDQFKKIDIGLDNAWFNELASVYCKLPEGADPAENKGPYWDYYSYENAEGETVDTGIPVPYYYMIKYNLNSSTYGVLTPIFVDYAPTTVAVNEDGTLSVTAIVDKANVEFANNIVYHNFKFVRFTNAVTEGMKLTDDRTVTCEVYLGTRVTPSATATGSNKGWLSNKGGLVWEFSFATRTLTISAGTKVANTADVAAILAKLGDFKDEITEESVISDVLGLLTAADIAEIAAAAGLSSAEEFAALANKLAILELSASNDPLIATADVLAASGIVTVEDLGAFIAAMEAEGAAENADLQAKLVALAEASLDSKNLNDLYAKLTAAEVTGNIADEFNALKTTLKAFEDKGVLVTDVHAGMIAREKAMADLAAASVKEFLVGDAAAFDAAVTVADLVAAIGALQDAEGLFKTWDYATSEDTSVMWASSRSYANYVEKIVINDGIKHLGSYLFAALTSVKEIILPASVESIDANAFSGCSSINNIYYAGADLNNIKVLDASKDGKEIGTLYKDRVLQGNYAHAYAYTETAQAGEGKFWMNIGDTKIAWALASGKLRIGGPSVIYDFETPEAAPWYGAKDSITKVVIASHITAIGENIANGYANVTALDLGEGYGAIKSIPASAFAGTGYVTNEANYNSKGILFYEDGASVYVLGYNGNDEFVRIPNYTVSIAEGIFDANENFDKIYLPQTILGLHPETFLNNAPTIIFFKGNSDSWNSVCGDLVFAEGTEYYVALSDRKPTDNPDFFFTFEQKGDEFVITDGCIHVYTEWTETKAPTCSVAGEKQRSCTGDCGKTFTEVVPALGHDWSAWTPCADAPTYEERWCQNENCDVKCSVEGCAIHADHADDCADDCAAHKQAAHEKVMINSEYTFEGIDAVKDNQIKLSDTTNSKYTIVEIGTDAHAFEYEKTAKEVNAEFTVFATQAGTLATAKVITYKSDLKIDNTNKKVSIDLVFRSEADPSVKALVLNLLATDGKNLDVGAKSGYGADAVVGDYVSLGVKTGEWFNLKVEYYADGAASVAKVYVGETLVYITDVFYGSEVADATPVSAGVADSVSFVPASNYLGKISLDNVTLVQGNEYEFDGKTSLIGAITFDEVPPASLVKVDGTAVIVTKDDAKYYSITSRVGDSSTGYYTFYAQSAANSANVAIFETDLQITRTAGSRAWAIRFRGGNNGGTAYMLEFRHDLNTNTLYVADKSESRDNIAYKSPYIQPKDADGNLDDIQVGDWVNVRVEYYEAKAGDAESVRMLTYINGVLVLYSNNWYGVTTEQESGGNVPHPVTVGEITDAYIQPYTSHRGEWNVDNTLFYKTYATAPTDPITLKYDDYDGKAIDDGGVIRTDWVQEDDRLKALKNLVNDPVDEEEEDIFVPEEDAGYKVITFDDLEALPANTYQNGGSGELLLVSEGTNKFLSVTNKARPVITLTGDKKNDAVAAVFEATIRLNSTSTGSNAFNFFMTKESTSDRAFEMQFKEVDGKFVIYTVSKGLNQADFSVDATPTEITKNQWFELRYEYNESGKTTIYIDGKVVLETENYYTKTTEATIASEVVPAEEINGIWVVPFSANAGNFDFDNVAMYHLTADELADAKNYVTFDDLEALPANIAHNSGNGTLAIVAEGENKFFRVTEGTSSTRWFMGLTEEANADATSAIFEAKMRYNISKDGGNGATNMFFITGNDNSARAFEFQFNYAGGNVMFSTREGTDAAGANTTQGDLVYELTDSGVALNTWFDFKAEYTDAGKLIISVNGNVVLESENFYNKFNPAFDAANVTGTWFVPFGGTTGTFDIDNFAFYHVADKATEKPHEHVFVEGKCECGEEDPNYVPEYIPEGTVTFNDIATGDWALGYTNDVLIGVGAQQHSDHTTTVVADGGNKYLSFNKVGKTEEGSSTAMSWIVFEKAAVVEEGAPVWFETKMSFTKTNGSGHHIRMYTDRTAAKPVDGTGEIAKASRIAIKVESGYVTIAGQSTGVAAGEWFTIRLVFEGSTMTLYILGANGEFAAVHTLTDDAFANIKAVQFTNTSNDYANYCFDKVYFGGAYTAPDPDAPTEEPKEDELLEGTLTFEDMKAGDWVLNTGDSVLIGGTVQANAQGSFVVVEEDGNKYFSMIKSGCDASGGRQSWVVFEKTAVVPEGTPIVFETKIRHTPVQGSSSYFRFYNGRTAANSGSGGSVYGVTGAPRNVTFAASSGKMMLDSTIDLGVKSGEWFTLRFVFAGNTLSVFTNDENGEMVQRGEITRTEWVDFKDMTSVMLMNDSTTFHTTDFDNVYFGPYVADVESPIEKLPAFESELPEGNISFNDIEAELPEEITLLTEGDSALSVVAVSRANKVLALDKNAGADARLYLNATKKTVGANVLAFATQMYFDKVDAAGYVDFTLMPSGSAEGDRVYKIRMSASAEGNLTIAPVALVDGADVVGDAVDTGVAVGSWFKLSIVYAEKDNTFTVSVNGEAKLTATDAYGMFKDASAISQVLILANDALAADVYFENMSLSQIIAE